MALTSIGTGPAFLESRHRVFSAAGKFLRRATGFPCYGLLQREWSFPLVYVTRGGPYQLSFSSLCNPRTPLLISAESTAQNMAMEDDLDDCLFECCNLCNTAAWKLHSCPSSPLADDFLWYFMRQNGVVSPSRPTSIAG